MITLFGLPVVVVAADEQAIREAIRRARVSTETVVELVNDLAAASSNVGESSGGTAEDVRDQANQAPVVRFVNLLIREASRNGASDIHLDAVREGLAIGIRVDGVLSALPAPPSALQDAVFSRTKLMAGLDIAERRATPRTGAFVFGSKNANWIFAWRPRRTISARA